MCIHVYPRVRVRARALTHTNVRRYASTNLVNNQLCNPSPQQTVKWPTGWSI